MKKVLKIKDWESAEVLFSDVRQEILALCRERPYSIKALADALDYNPGTIFNHLKKLRNAGIIELVETRMINGIEEKKYQTTAAFFDLSELEESALPKRNEKIAQDCKKKVKRLLERGNNPSVKHLSVYLETEDLEYIREELQRLRDFMDERQVERSTGARKCTFLYAIGGEPELE